MYEWLASCRQIGVKAGKNCWILVSRNGVRATQSPAALSLVSDAVMLACRAPRVAKSGRRIKNGILGLCGTKIGRDVQQVTRETAGRLSKSKGSQLPSPSSAFASELISRCLSGQSESQITIIPIIDTK